MTYRKPMIVPSFKPGDLVVTPAGWEGTIVRKNPNPHNGYRVRWTDVRGNKFAPATSDISPLNLAHRGTEDE